MTQTGAESDPLKPGFPGLSTEPMGAVHGPAHTFSETYVKAWPGPPHPCLY